MPFGQSRIPVGLQKPAAHSIGCELLTAAWSAFKKKLHCPSNLKSIPLSALRSLCKNLFKDQSCQFRDQSKGVRLCHSSPKLTMLIGALQIQMSFPSARTNVCITSTKSVQCVKWDKLCNQFCALAPSFTILAKVQNDRRAVWNNAFQQRSNPTAASCRVF